MLSEASLAYGMVLVWYVCIMLCQAVLVPICLSWSELDYPFEVSPKIEECEQV